MLHLHKSLLLLPRHAPSETNRHTLNRTPMAEICEPFFSVTVSDAWHIPTPEGDQCRYVQREIEIHRKLGGASDLLE